MIYATALALTLVASASATLHSEDPSQQMRLWESFKKEFGRAYETMDEEKQRFGFFVENLRVADHRNLQETKNGGTAVHGITRFSDMSQSEFESKLLNSDRSLKTRKGVELPPNSPAVKLDPTSYVEWRDVYTTPVKDQGYCGSCWAFSATEQIESDFMRTAATTYELSPEQIVQCDQSSYGCQGGWTESAYAYVQRAGGIVQNSDYPYTSYQGTTGTCHVDKSQFVVSLSDFKELARDEATMANYVQTTGPLSVCVDASRWNSYKGGIMTQCGNRVDHCVQATGVLPAGTSGFWNVRNSWGVTWGEAGYIRLAYGGNTCDITNDPTYTTVGKV